MALGKKRKSQTPPAAAAPPPRPAKARFRMQRYADGSLRAVRLQSRGESFLGQARADFFGAGEEAGLRANVHRMDALLAELLADLHLQEEEIAPELLADAWRRAAGDFLAGQAELLSIAKGCARIRTMHPAVRFELTRMRTAIIRSLNAILGEGSVKRIQVIHA